MLQVLYASASCGDDGRKYDIALCSVTGGAPSLPSHGVERSNKTAFNTVLRRRRRGPLKVVIYPATVRHLPSVDRDHPT
jgi:hypothetical protein